MLLSVAGCTYWEDLAEEFVVLFGSFETTLVS